MNKIPHCRALSPLIILVLFLTSGTAMAGELNKRIKTLAGILAADAVKSGLGDAAISISQFQADPWLTEKKHDRVCTEILTNRLIDARVFRVIDRSRLEAVLKERKLISDGVVNDPGTVRDGRIPDDILRITGKITRAGDFYTLNVELTEERTGRVLSSAKAEIAEETFEDEAGLYLAWPENAFSVRLTGLYFPIDTTEVPPSDLSERVIPENPSGSLLGYGIGGSFSFRRKWLINISLFPYLSITPDAAEFSAGQKYPAATLWRGEGTQFTLDKRIRISRSISGLAGFGGAAFRLHNRGRADMSVDVGYGNAYHISIVKKSFIRILPILQLGVEWKPKGDFSLSLFGQYSLLKPGTVTEHADVTTNDGTFAETRVRKFSLPRFYTSTALTYYFSLDSADER